MCIELRLQWSWLFFWFKQKYLLVVVESGQNIPIFTPGSESCQSEIHRFGGLCTQAILAFNLGSESFSCA